MPLLIHTSDFHIGVPIAGFRGRDIRGLRRQDIFNNIKSIFEYSVKNNVNVVIISGDIFHTPNPSPRDFLAFDRMLKLLEDKKIYVVMIAGNHDKRKIRDEKGFLGIYQTRGGKYIYFYDNIGQKPLTIDINGKKISFIIIPFISGLFVRALTKENYKRKYEEIIKFHIDRQLEKLGGTSDYNILIGHLTVSGADIGPKICYIAYDDPPVSHKTLKASEFDYIALGHIHVAQNVHRNIYYAGSIERIDFSEERLTKSFYEINLRNNEVNRILLSAREMRTFDIFLDTYQDPVKKVINEISDKNIKNLLLRIRVGGEAELVNKIYSNVHELDNYILNKLGAAGYKIDTQYTSPTLPETPKIEKVKIVEFFEEYVKKRFKNRRREVIQKAVELGREILEK